jgi:pyridoxamine 5'-phosphate oxidase
VLQYFDKAAHLHHSDEEQNLMPMLQTSATGDDAALLAILVPEILKDHRQMDLAWNVIKVQLEAIGNGTSSALSMEQVHAFAASYEAHMAKEESHLAPMAKRLFDAAQMAQLGAAMQQRRAIVPKGESEGESKQYDPASLLETDVLSDPLAQFRKWFDEALTAQVSEPHAMALSTVSVHGKPSSRIVLIEQCGEHGFTWSANYGSRKGEQLEGNPNAALLFFWRELERQVAIEGRVVKTPEQDNDQHVDSRAAQEANYAAVVAASGSEPQRAPHWGRYCLVPARIEFWQGRQSRFHDAIVFTLEADGSWLRQRLQP